MGEKVALIGVGKMGRALLDRLHGAGHRITVYDIAEEPMSTARDMGAATANSSAEAAREAVYVHVFVHNDQEVLDATLGTGGVLSGAGTGCIIFLHSTILPETTARVAEAANVQGITVLDASVTSVPQKLLAGEGTFLVGGPDEFVSKIRPYLELLGKAVFHFGPLGSGNVAKIAKNLTNAVERLMWVETVQIVEAAGLDVRKFLNMAKSVNSSAMINEWDKVIRIEDSHAGPQRARGLFRKDVQHAARLADFYGLNLPITRKTAYTAAKLVEHWEAEAN